MKVIYTLQRLKYNIQDVTLLILHSLFTYQNETMVLFSMNIYIKMWIYFMFQASNQEAWTNQIMI